jgi:dissimilatory sulfite reductase (desulfoviridin) alpha/beta subunit
MGQIQWLIKYFTTEWNKMIIETEVFKSYLRMGHMDKEQIAALKRQGFILQKGGEFFTVRVKLQAGNITSEQMTAVKEIADRYGRGYVGITTRLNIEVPWIELENLEKVKAELEKVKLSPGGTGPTVRPIVTCKGTICSHGLVDTQGLCKLLDERFFAKEAAAKFKIGIVGCPNNCAKAQLNDLGIMGQCKPILNAAYCRKCGLCSSACKLKAIKVDEHNISIDDSICINCGDCINACKLGCITIENQGFSIFVGGKFGKKYRIGDKLEGIYKEEAVPVIVEKLIEYYNANAKKGERIANLIDREGLETLIDGLNLYNGN